MPAQSLIRCPHSCEELRPLASYLDCETYLALHWGGTRARPEIVEPPQSVALATEDLVCEVEADAALPRPAAGPSPEVAAAQDGTAECGGRLGLSARFATVRICRAPTLEASASDGSGLPAPVSPEARGKGGTPFDPCTCQCSCPDLFGGVFGGPLGDRPFRVGRAGARPLVVVAPWTPWDPYRPDYPFPPTPPRAKTPIRIFGGEPEEQPLPPLGPYGEDYPRPPTPPREEPPTRILGGEPEDGRGGWPPPFAPSGVPAATVLASDAPPEDIFEGETCPWCGLVRGGADTKEERPGALVAPAGGRPPSGSLEPPLVEPAPAAAPQVPTPGVRSFGTDLEVMRPPLHSEGTGAARLITPEGVAPTTGTPAGRTAA